MARLIVPTEGIQYKRGKTWATTSKVHLLAAHKGIERGSRITVCNRIVWMGLFGSAEYQRTVLLADVKPEDLCKKCLGALGVED